MQRVAVLTLVLLFGLAVVAQADPVVTLGTYNVAPGVASIPIQIFAYANNTGVGPGAGTNNSVQGLDLNVAIHDLNGVAPAVDSPPQNGPNFTAGATGQGNVNNSAYVGGVGSNGGIGGDVLTGTIFGNFAGHTVPTDNGLSVSQGINLLAVGTGGAFLPLSTNPGAPSLIATVYISTVGVAAGTQWVLSIGGGQNGDPGPDQGPLDFADGGTFNTALTDGTINVVPEPSSVVMALFAAAGLAAVAVRRARRA
jgi:hypothetical protein